MSNKKKMKTGLSEYYEMRRAYVADKGKAPPKGTKKADLEAMGYSKKKKKPRSTKKRKKKRKSTISSNSGLNWKNIFW